MVEGVSKRCPPMGKARGVKRLPWLWRLLKAWVRELAAQYFSGTFPMYSGVRGKDCRVELPKVVESADERAVRTVLKLLHVARKIRGISSK